MKEKCPLATIHILTYNAFDHIYVNLDSVLRQTYCNIEIIIADDGSKEFPKQEIEDYILQNKGDNINNVVILENKKNIGTVRNLNNAIRHSNGDVYIPLSQDDNFFSDDVVELIMRRYVEKPFNVLITSRYGVNKNGDFLRYWPHLKARKIIERMSTAEMFRAYSESWFSGLASGSVMNISSTFISEFGLFDEKYYLWEDGPFFFKCLLHGHKIDTAYDIVSIRYEQTEGVSNNPNTLMQRDIKVFLDSDFILGKDDYGFMHSRYISFYYKRIKSNSIFKKIILYAKYFDVSMMQIVNSERFRRWAKYDKAYENRKKIV